MPNYQNSKIYAIKSYQTEYIYIGSTTRPLSERMSEHRKGYRYYLKGSLKNPSKSIEILKYDDCYIELIEKYPCSDRTELNKKEGEHIKNNKCINRCIAGRTKKEWYEKNKDKILKHRKEYREKNKDKIKEYQKKWYKKNKDKIISKFQDQKR